MLALMVGGGGGCGAVEDRGGKKKEKKGAKANASGFDVRVPSERRIEVLTVIGMVLRHVLKGGLVRPL